MQKTRLVFIDLLRGWAILVMIEVHVFNTFMYSALRDTWWFHILNFINGLVAPSFIFISGFVFVLSSKRKMPEFRTFGSAFWKQLRRILLIWVIGYIMHIPFYSFKKISTKMDYQHWLILFQSDVLHCIAFGLTLLFLLSLLIKSDKALKNIFLLLSIFIVSISPFIWDVDFTKIIHPFFSAYINGKHNSIFPLFPWLAFMLVGGMTSLLYLDFVSKNKENEFMKRLFFTGLIIILIGFIFSYIPIEFKYYSKSLRPNPFFFLQRLGIVLSLLSICWYYAMKRQTEKSFVIDSSRESLFIYVFHLQIIFAAFYNNKSLSDLFKNSFGVIECIIATIVLITAMVFAAKGWSWLKNHSMKSARFAMLALVVFLLIIFFTKDTWLEKYYPF